MAGARAPAVFLGLGLRLRAQEGQWLPRQREPFFFKRRRRFWAESRKE